MYIAAGTYKENKLTISKNLTIIGAGKTNTTIDATGSNLIFWIKPGVTVTLRNLNITNGTASKTDFSRNGGGIYNEGTLTIDNCVFYNNRAQDASDAGGAAGSDASAAGNGGAIYNKGTLTVTNCEFNSNHAGQGGDASATHKSSAGGSGGAIYNAGLILNIQACTFRNNYAGRGGASSAFHDGKKGGDGGAIYNSGTINNIQTCNFISNHAGNGGYTQNGAAANPGTGGNGGAIGNTGTITVTNSTFDGNYAGNGGEGTDIQNGATGGYGGAIYNNGIFTISDSELKNNRAGKGGKSYGAFNPGDYGKGGAIYNAINGKLTLTNDTFTNNTSCYGGALSDESKYKTNVTNCNFNSNTVQAFDEDGNPVEYNTFNMTTGQIVKTIIYGISGVINTFSWVYTPAGLSKIVTTVHDVLASITKYTVQATGGAIYMGGSSYLNIDSCTFYNSTAAIGGGIHNFGNGTLNITNSVFNNNAAGLGAAIYSNNLGTLIVENCLFNGNIGGDNGGIFFGGTTSNLWAECNITGNTFKNNTACFGAIFYNGINGVSHSYFNFNRIYGTNNYDVFNEYALNKIDAKYNWWGSNLGPDTYSTNSDCNIDTSHYMVLAINSPTNMTYGENATISVDMLHDNYGVYQEPKFGIIGDGIQVKLNTTNGNISPNLVTLVNGVANISYFANGNVGQADIYALADNDERYPSKTTINILKILTTTHNVNIKYYGAAGSNVTLNATVYDYKNNPVNQGNVTFNLGNQYLTAPVVNGNAVYVWTIPSNAQPNNSYNIYTTYNGNSIYASSNDPYQSQLVVVPSADVVLTKEVLPQITLGQEFTAKVTAENKGPDIAKGIVFSNKIPSQFEFISASADKGTWTYDSATRLFTWNIGNLELGETAHLYLTLKSLQAGTYRLLSNLTTVTYDPNMENQNTPLVIKVKASKGTKEGNENLVQAGRTIEMRKTGLPVAGLILAILMVLSGGLASIKELTKRGDKRK